MTAVNVQYAAFLEKKRKEKKKKKQKSPCRVQSAQPATHRLSSSRFLSWFLIDLGELADRSASRWTRCRSWCPFVLYFGDRGSLLPYFVTFQTSPISFIFQTQGYCQYAQLPSCVCTCVCLRVCACMRLCMCVCVCIYIKRESNIYESIFSYFVMRAIDKKQKRKTKSFSFFFPQWDTAILF